MTPIEVYRYYATGYQFAKKTGMSAGTLGNWMKKGYVPIDAQCKLQVMTSGELMAEFREYRIKKKRKARVNGWLRNG